MTAKSIEELKQLTKDLRREIIQITGRAGSGHPSSSFSALEILSALYFGVLRHDPNNPDWPDRDRFILSKGHAAPGLYAVMARAGYFPVEQLKTLRKLESPLQGHPEKNRLQGIEASTGSLGQGISIGIGMALAARLNKKDYRVYVLTGDGELDEGQVWEAAMFATHYQLDNLTVIVDRNKIQQDSWCKEVMNTEPLLEKWQSFGWYVIDINGHDLEQVIAALTEAKKVKGKPAVIIARTVKGKGVSFMENSTSFHGVAPTPEQVEMALKELA
jgi:transketolase